MLRGESPATNSEGEILSGSRVRRGVAVLVATAAVCVLAAPAGAALRLDVFAPGSNGHVHHLAYDGAWSGWQDDLGGAVAPGSGPAAVSWGPGRIDLFVRGTDNALHHRAWAAGQWHGWENLGGTLTGNPAVSSWGAGRLDVFARGTNGRIHHIAYDGGWHGWEDNLGGTPAAGSGPAAVSWGPGRIDLFVRGTDNALHHRAWAAGQWHGWESLGGTLTGDPTAASWGVGRLDVFVRGSNGRVHHRPYDGAWYGWQDSLGGALAAGSGPAAVSPRFGRLDVFVRGTADGLHQQVWSGSWLGWGSLGGVLTGNPAVSSWRYATSEQYGGSNYSVDTDAELQAVYDAMAASPSSQEQMLEGLAPADQALFEERALTVAGGDATTTTEPFVADDSESQAAVASGSSCKRKVRVVRKKNVLGGTLFLVKQEVKWCWRSIPRELTYVGRLAAADTPMLIWKKVGPLDLQAWGGKGDFEARRVATQTFEFCPVKFGCLKESTLTNDVGVNAYGEIYVGSLDSTY